jgi:putative membrane protein
MKLISEIFIGIVAIIHIYILWLEMFAWTTQGRKTFKTIAPNLFEPTKVLAANQGLYNGFLAAGLIWSLLISNPLWSANVAYFFLSCVAFAGLYGAVTAQRSILFVQTLPTAIAALFVFLSQQA